MDDLPAPTRDLLALTLVPGLGPRLTAALVRHFGTAAAVMRADPAQMRQIPHIGEKLARQFTEALRGLDVQPELDAIARHGVRITTIGELGYPAALARIPDPPTLLYRRGTFTEADARAVAIVGSRQCSNYGRKMAGQIAAGLARAGFTVVSGLALGVDGAAHDGALKAGGRTIAVLAGGLSRIYPPDHLELSRAVEQSGCLLSETPMALPPQPGMFHARNRIISGLSRAIVIVEAGERSGALITASHAAEQGRELFAVPANVDSPFSAGTLRLLRNGARLVRGIDDILEDLGGIAPIVEAAAAQPAPEPPALDEPQRRVWEQLAGGSRHVDDLASAIGMPVAQLGGLLMQLELKKVVRRLPGNVYERS